MKNVDGNQDLYFVSISSEKFRIIIFCIKQKVLIDGLSGHITLSIDFPIWDLHFQL